MAQIAYGWTAEEIQINHRYLSMSQIHSAFAYYWDHKEAMDFAIAEDFDYAQKTKQHAGESPFVIRLKAQIKKPRLIF
jgi:hypothetical protein